MSNLRTVGEAMGRGEVDTADVENFPGTEPGKRYVAYVPIRAAWWSLALTSSPHDPITTVRQYLAARAARVSLNIFAIIIFSISIAAILIFMATRRPSVSATTGVALPSAKS